MGESGLCCGNSGENCVNDNCGVSWLCNSNEFNSCLFVKGCIDSNFGGNYFSSSNNSVMSDVLVVVFKKCWYFKLRVRFCGFLLLFLIYWICKFKFIFNIILSIIFYIFFFYKIVVLFFKLISM